MPLRAFSSMSAAARDESRPVEVPAVAMPEADAQGDLLLGALDMVDTPLALHPACPARLKTAAALAAHEGQ
jgi:hypothetical protein